MKNLSVSQAMLACIKSHGPMSAADIAERIKKPAAQVFTSAWKLTKANKLVKENGVLKLVNAPALTAIKPNMAKPSSTIRSITPMEKALSDRVSKAEKEVDSLKRELTQMSVNYYDALAVIKYLESKIKA